MTEITGGNTTPPAQPTTLPTVLSIIPAPVDPIAAELWCCLRDRFSAGATAVMFDAVAKSARMINAGPPGMN